MLLLGCLLVVAVLLLYGVLCVAVLVVVGVRCVQGFVAELEADLACYPNYHTGSITRKFIPTAAKVWWTHTRTHTHTHTHTHTQRPE